MGALIRRPGVIGEIAGLKGNLLNILESLAVESYVVKLLDSEW